MDQLRGWLKVIVSWIAAVGGWFIENLTVGKVALLATVILTLLQAFKVWLEIQDRLRARRAKEKDDDQRFQ